MTSRERFLLAIGHRTPDRVPTFFRRTAEQKDQLAPDAQRFVDEVADVGEYLNMRSPDGEFTDREGIHYNELGIGYRFEGAYAEIAHHPLANMNLPEELMDYPWPDVTCPARVAHLRSQAEAIRSRGKAVAAMGSWGGSTGIFEMSWYMRGLEQFLCDCLVDQPFAERLLDLQLELHKRRWEAILREIGELTDIVCMGDDLGTQRGPLISLALYRDLIKPRQRELIRHIRKFTDAPVYYHSCGAVEIFLPDLIEIGVSILDPIQPGCLDMERLKERFGRDLAFYGGVDVQRVLPYGTPAQVRAEVLLRFRQLGENGGLVLGPSHWMQPDVPWENIRAMYDAIMECRYDR